MEVIRHQHSRRLLRFYLPAFGRRLEYFARGHSSRVVDKVLLWLCDVLTSNYFVYWCMVETAAFHCVLNHDSPGKICQAMIFLGDRAKAARASSVAPTTTSTWL